MCLSVRISWTFSLSNPFPFYFLLSSWSFCKNFLREHFLGRKNLRLSVKPSKERSITVRTYFVSKRRLCLSSNGWILSKHRKSCKYIPWNTFNALDSPLQPSSQLRMIADIIVIVNVSSAMQLAIWSLTVLDYLQHGFDWIGWPIAFDDHNIHSSRILRESNSWTWPLL